MTPLRPRLPLGLIGLGLALHSTHALAADTVALAPVKVTEVYGSDGYQAREAQVGGLHNAPLLDTPAAVSVFTRQLLDDRQVRKLSEVLQSDASVGESYAPVGYYENFNVRGFELNAASSYRVTARPSPASRTWRWKTNSRWSCSRGCPGCKAGCRSLAGWSTT